jgi:hypothetical protein
MIETDKPKEITSIHFEPQLTIDRLYLVKKPGGMITQEADIRLWEVMKEFKLD